MNRSFLQLLAGASFTPIADTKLSNSLIKQVTYGFGSSTHEKKLRERK